MSLTHTQNYRDEKQFFISKFKHADSWYPIGKSIDGGLQTAMFLFCIDDKPFGFWVAPGRNPTDEEIKNGPEYPYVIELENAKWVWVENPNSLQNKQSMVLESAVVTASKIVESNTTIRSLVVDPENHKWIVDSLLRSLVILDDCYKRAIVENDHDYAEACKISRRNMTAIIDKFVSKNFKHSLN